jgi:hypothetical protein
MDGLRKRVEQARAAGQESTAAGDYVGVVQHADGAAAVGAISPT